MKRVLGAMSREDALRLAEELFSDRSRNNRLDSSDTSINTLYKRENILPDNPTEDGGLLGSARPSDRSCPEKKSSAHGKLTRQDIFAVDVLGRRERLPVEEMSEASYQKLLDAARNPIRVDGPMPEIAERSEPAPARPPEWWEMPDKTATAEEVRAAFRRNLEELEKRRGNAPGGWKRTI